MADKIMVDLSGLSDYTPYEGMGSNDLFTHDGMFKVKILKITSGISKGSSNPKFTVQQVVLDEDNKGKNLVSTVLLGGVDAKGNKLVRQLGDLLASVGTSMEKIRALNGTIDADQLANQLTGKEAHVQVEAEQYEGKFSSKLQNYVTPKAYTDAVAAGAHRKPHRANQPFAGAPGGAQAGSQTIANLGGAAAGAKPNGAAAPGTDALNQLAGMNLGL